MFNLGDKVTYGTGKVGTGVEVLNDYIISIDDNESDYLDAELIENCKLV